MDSYVELHALDTGAIVVDQNGQVWLVEKHRHGETWLCPFSDEYAFQVNADGTTVAMGDIPTLPIRQVMMP